MSVQILMANTLDGLENKIGHALNEGWDLAGHITSYTVNTLTKSGMTEHRNMFYILVMKA